MSSSAGLSPGHSLCPGVCRSPSEIRLLNRCRFSLNTWLTSLLPPPVLPWAMGGPGCLRCPRGAGAGQSCALAVLQQDEGYENCWMKRADALAGRSCRNCCQGPALEQSPLILCCILHPLSLLPQLWEAGQRWRKEPACCWLVVCSIAASRADPRTRAWGALAAKPSW